MSERCQEIELGRKCVLTDGHAEEHDFGWLSAAGARPAPGERGRPDVVAARERLKKAVNRVTADYGYVFDPFKSVDASELRRSLEDFEAAVRADAVLSALPGAAASGREDERDAHSLADDVERVLGPRDSVSATIPLPTSDWRLIVAALRARSAPRPGGEGDRQEIERLTAALQRVVIEMSLLVAKPSEPDFTPVTTNGNPADVDCLTNAYEAAREALESVPARDDRFNCATCEDDGGPCQDCKSVPRAPADRATANRQEG